MLPSVHPSKINKITLPLTIKGVDTTLKVNLETGFNYYWQLVNIGFNLNSWYLNQSRLHVSRLKSTSLLATSGWNTTCPVTKWCICKGVSHASRCSAHECAWITFRSWYCVTAIEKHLTLNLEKGPLTTLFWRKNWQPRNKCLWFF